MMFGDYMCDTFIVDGIVYGYDGHDVYVVDMLRGSMEDTVDRQDIARKFFLSCPIEESDCEICEPSCKRLKS